MSAALKNRMLQLLEKQAKSKYIELIKQKKPLVIGITGSVGKTTTKLFLAQVLGHYKMVAFDEKSYNESYAAPMTALGIDATITVKNYFKKLYQVRSFNPNKFNKDIIILELGADAPGQIAHFVEYIKPDIGIVTALSPVHLEKMKDIGTILREKWALADVSEKVYYNGDFEILRKKVLSLPADQRKKMTSYGSLASNECRFRTFGKQVEFTFKTRRVTCENKIISDAQLTCLSVCFGILEQLKLEESNEAKRRILESIDLPAGRGRSFTRAGVTVIDESYNANPANIRAAIQTLSRMPAKRRILVLGRMNELGDNEKAEHRNLSKDIAASNVDVLLTCKDIAELYSLDFRRVKKHFESPVDLGQYLAKIVKDGDVIMVKGSQGGIYLEEAIKFIIDKRDYPKLVRQNKGWLNKKLKEYPDIIY